MGGGGVAERCVGGMVYPVLGREPCPHRAPRPTLRGSTWGSVGWELMPGTLLTRRGLGGETTRGGSSLGGVCGREAGGRRSEGS